MHATRPGRSDRRNWPGRARRNVCQPRDGDLAIHSAADIEGEPILSEVELPQTYHFGQELDGAAPDVPVSLYVELPFWLLVPNTTVEVTCGQRSFRVDIHDDFEELHAGTVTSTRWRLVHLGPEGAELSEDVRELFEKPGIPLVPRPCKTVLRLETSCNTDVLASIIEGRPGANAARYYLRDFCAAHVSVVNELVRGYRLATYDPFAYEISPWDVPFWLVDIRGRSESVMVIPYLDSDRKPEVHEIDGSVHPHSLMDAVGLAPALVLRPFPGELDLLDAENLMVRGDYSGAVRHIATALEVALEAALRRTLSQTLAPEDLDRELAWNEHNFYMRLQRYESASRRELGPELWSVLRETRDLRKAIVHDGHRVRHAERGRAQKAVDTGRWIFNWLEDNPERADARERSIGRRSLGRHFSHFDPDPCANGGTPAAEPIQAP